MRKFIVFLMVVALLFMSIPSSVFAVFSAVNLGPTSDLDGDVNVPSGKGYYIDGTLLAVGDITSAVNVTLSNLGTTAINDSLIPAAADTSSLGTDAKEWLSLYIGDAGSLFLGLGQDCALTRSGDGVLTVTAANGVVITAAGLTVGSVIKSDTVDTDDLGATDMEWANLYIGTVGKIHLGLTQEVTLEVTDADTLAITAGDVDFTGNLEVAGGIIVGANIVSDTDVTDDLGGVNKNWLEVYIGDAGHLYLGSGQDTNVARTGAGILTLTAANGVVTSAGLTVTGDLLPAAASTHSLGSGAAEWTDIYLDDTGYVYFGIAQDVHIQRNTDNEMTLTASSGVTTSAGLTVGGTLAMAANDITITGSIGRDTTTDFIGWGVDDSLAIEIGNVAHAIVSISDGGANNDKLVTQGYVDDVAGTTANYILHCMDIDAADVDFIVEDSMAENKDWIAQIDGQPDYGRNITVTGSALADGTVTITGTLADGTTAQTDAIVVVADNTAEGVKAFTNITNIVLAGWSAGSCTVGIGDIIGLQNAISAEADIYLKTVDGVAVYSEISGNVNLANNTLDCGTIVQNEDITLYYHN